MMIFLWKVTITLIDHLFAFFWVKTIDSFRCPVRPLPLRQVMTLVMMRRKKRWRVRSLCAIPTRIRRPD